MQQGKLREIFYDLVKDGENGFSVIMGELDYVRFNYFEQGHFFNKNMTDIDYLGNEEKVNEEYEAEYSNGTANYIPLLKVDDKNKFFELLEKYVNRYWNLYNFDKVAIEYGEEDSVKAILLTFLANARYQDYSNPIPYLERFLNFFEKSALSKYENLVISRPIPFLENSTICVNNRKDYFGYETPYRFDISLKVANTEYKLPIINYGISDGVCYIYSIQNKEKNEDNQIVRKINRKFYKVNDGVENDTDYDTRDTILGTTPSFILTMPIFLKVLRENNIDIVRVITLLPDRYMEKIATEDNQFDANKIQSNITEKMILLCYRLQHHFKKIRVNYPIGDGYSMIDDENIGEDVILSLPEVMETNNDLLNEVMNSINSIRYFRDENDTVR